LRITTDLFFLFFHLSSSFMGGERKLLQRRLICEWGEEPGKTYSTSVYLDTSNHRVCSSCFLLDILYVYLFHLFRLFISFCLLCLLSLLSLLSVRWNMHMRLCLAFLLFLIRVWQDSCMIGFEGVGAQKAEC